MLEFIEKAFEIIVHYSALLLEGAGTAVIILYAVRAAVNLLKKRPVGKKLLYDGAALALEFLLCGEILHTILIQDAMGLLVTGGIMVMRAAMALLIHYEVKAEAGEETEKS